MTEIEAKEKLDWFNEVYEENKTYIDIDGISTATIIGAFLVEDFDNKFYVDVQFFQKPSNTNEIKRFSLRNFLLLYNPVRQLE